MITKEGRSKERPSAFIPTKEIILMSALNLEMTVLGLARGVTGWTSITGPMSLVVRDLARRELVETQNDTAPSFIEYRLTPSGGAFTETDH